MLKSGLHKVVIACQAKTRRLRVAIECTPAALQLDCSLCLRFFAPLGGQHTELCTHSIHHAPICACRASRVCAGAEALCFASLDCFCGCRCATAFAHCSASRSLVGQRTLTASSFHAMPQSTMSSLRKWSGLFVNALQLCVRLLLRVLVLLPCGLVLALIVADVVSFLSHYYHETLLQKQHNLIVMSLLTLTFCTSTVLLVWSYFLSIMTSSSIRANPMPDDYLPRMRRLGLEIRRCARCKDQVKALRSHHCSVSILLCS